MDQEQVKVRVLQLAAYVVNMHMDTALDMKFMDRADVEFLREKIVDHLKAMEKIPLDKLALST